MEQTKKVEYSTTKKIGLFGGLIAAAIILLLPGIEGLGGEGQKALALTVLMVFWWVTEAVPIWVTALLPLVVPPLIGLAGTKPTESKINIYGQYASPVVMMSLGVFLLAAVIEKWNLHKRIALNIVYKMGDRSSMIIFGFALATGFVSMFMSNVTAVAMMLPIGVAMIKQLGLSPESGFAKALALSIAFAASIGGMGTMIGSGTNVAGVALMRELAGIDITFVEWLKVGVPFVVILLPLSIFALNKMYKVKEVSLGDNSIIAKELKSLGPMSKAEKLTTAYLVFAIGGFIFRAQLSKIFPFLTDEGFAVLVGIILFLIPVDFNKGLFLMDSKTAIKEISWSTFLLLGGALTLGDIFSKAGIAAWVAGGLGFLSALPEIAIIFVIAVLVAVITEACSNFVVASAFLPVIYGIALQLGIEPMLLMMTVTLSASFAFMMPTGTPTNAIAFGSGYIDIKDMIKGGAVVKLLSIVIFPVVMYLIAAPLTSLF